MDAEYPVGTRVKINDRDDHAHIKLSRFERWDGRSGTVVAYERFESSMLDDQNPAPAHRYSIKLDGGEVIEGVPENIVEAV